MPIFCYECSHPRCMTQFEEFYNTHENSGKTLCPRCGNVAFKIPAIFHAHVFKPRVFADGTKTPDHVSTPSQEKAWMKSQGITYDKPVVNKRDRKPKKFIRDGFFGTPMEHAFKKAVEKIEQGYKPNIKPKKEVNENALRFKV